MLGAPEKVAYNFKTLVPVQTKFSIPDKMYKNIPTPLLNDHPEMFQ